ncbi:hypothetical protein [Paenibacillus mucilaginosus]|uniref:Uncharacterized protein n=2 Tax=Paenibacillus mucilaginosus TaxID=61624 RepID=F8FBY8_PAEMK|nr:hypothetical protein [Paenibacillus mucilaginosus]AEI43749.1 hypothetical protein KNP414_05225 [Paenibacillus mucilaginosus KNP414]WDM25258.1 hypothetical protein KCX80_22675 [Paenibacillus mucilaginosus]
MTQVMKQMKKQMKKQAVPLLTALLLTFLIGMVLTRPGLAPKPPGSGFTLTPVELFSGSERRYQPFLGPYAGRVDFTAASGRNLIVEYEIWKDGRLAMTPYSTSWDDIHAEGGPPVQGEFLYSVLDLSRDWQGDQLLVHSSLSPRDGEAFRTLLGRVDRAPRGAWTSLPLKQKLTLQPGQEAYVLVLAITPEGGTLQPGDLPQDALPSASWALGIKLILQE